MDIVEQDVQQTKQSSSEVASSSSFAFRKQDLRKDSREVHNHDTSDQKAGDSYVRRSATSQNALETTLGTKEKPVESAQKAHAQQAVLFGANNCRSSLLHRVVSRVFLAARMLSAMVPSSKPLHTQFGAYSKCGRKHRHMISMI